MLIVTSGLFAYHSAAEQNHTDAITLFESASRKLIHSYILAELVALAYARRLPRQPVLAFIRVLLDHPQMDVVWVDADLNSRALRLLEERDDKSYSLADAVSFNLVRDDAMTEALTTDRHFEQEGCRRLLGP